MFEKGRFMRNIKKSVLAVAGLGVIAASGLLGAGLASAQISQGVQFPPTPSGLADCQRAAAQEDEGCVPVNSGGKLIGYNTISLKTHTAG